MIAAMVISMIVAEAAPIPIWFRVKVYEYMKVAGSSVARPGPLRRVLGAIKLPKPKPVNVVASGKIVRVRELARGNFELELDDGQVWRENERELRTNYRVGDMVVISSGMLGTFNLDNERSGQRTKARKIR